MSIADRLWGKPAYDMKGHLAYVQQLHAKYPLNSMDKCNAFSLALIKDTFRDYIPWLILEELEEMIIVLFDQNKIYFPEAPKTEDRELLTTYQRLLNPERIPVARAALINFLKSLPLPPSVFGRPKETTEDKILHSMGGAPKPKHQFATVELSTLIPNLAEHISQALHMTMNTKLTDQEIFPYTAADLKQNVQALSGSDTKIILPSEYKDDPSHYIAGTPFASLFLAQVPFEIPKKTWAMHGIVLAPPGFGKTELLKAFTRKFLEEPDAPGLFFLDPHGDAIAAIKERVDPKRLLLLDPDTSPPPLNFLDFGTSTEAQTLQTFSYLMSSLSGGLSDKQGAIVPYMLKLLRQVPGASLETLRLIVGEKIKSPDKSAFAEHIAKLPAVEQGFFHDQFYSSRMQETKEAIGWRIYAAMSSDAFRKMFGEAKTNSVNFDQALAERKVVLVKGGRNALGDDGMRIFLQYIIGQYFAAGLRRERILPEQRHLCLMLVDEASYVLNSPIIAQILVEMRKYGCAFLAATQVFEQIGQDIKAAVLGATAIKIAGPVSFSDANLLSREMYCSPDFIRNMTAKERSHADWAFYVSGLTDRKAVRVRVPYGQLEALPVQKHERQSNPAPPKSDKASASPTAPLSPQSESAEPLVKPGKNWTNDHQR
jgi:hypothetical protein